jgi:hypothetical protein
VATLKRDTTSVEQLNRKSRYLARKYGEDRAEILPAPTERIHTDGGDGPDIDLELEMYERFAEDERGRALARAAGIEAS